MVENYPIKIDDSGRIVIPSKIREMYGIKTGTKLLVTDQNDYVEFIKCEDPCDRLISLLKEIELAYEDIGFLLTEKGKIIYSTFDIDSSNTYPYYCDLNCENYTDFKLKIMYKYEGMKEVVEFISILFKDFNF